MDSHIINRNFSFFVIVLYVFLGGLTYSQFFSDDELASSILFFLKIFLIFILIFLKLSKLKIYKAELVIFIISIALFLSFDAYLMTLSFMMIVGLLFSEILTLRVSYLKWLNYSLIASILMVFLLSYLGVSKNLVFYDSNGFALEKRESLGFINPNPASILIAQAIFFSLYFKDKFLLLISIFLYAYTFSDLGSRTALGGFLLFLILYVFSRFPFLNKYYYFRTVGLLTIFSLIIFPIVLIQFIARGNWFFGGVDFNILLTTRLEKIMDLYASYGVNIYPSFLGSNVVDSGISNLLIGGGWVIYFLYIIYSYLYLKLEKNTFLILFFITFIGMNFVENIITGNMLLSIFLFGRFVYLLNLRRSD